MPARRIARPPQASADRPLAATGPPLRWGVVATGDIARTQSAQIGRLEDAELHAVSSRSPERAQAFAQQFGFATSYGDGDDGTPGYQRLAQDPEVDVVYVATPHGQHHPVAKAALEAGKHVLVEKAFTVNAREAAELITLARARGLFLMEGVWTRFLPIFHGLLDVFESGDLGEVQYLQADVGFRGDQDARRRLWAPEDGGGALLDLMIYPLTWTLGALGFPDEILARGVLTEEGVDASTALSLRFSGGAQAQLLATLTSHTTRSLRIGGTEGTLILEPPLTRPDSFIVQRGHDVRSERFSADGVRYTHQLREVTRCVQQGLTESPTMPLDDTLATMRLFDQARRQTGVVYPHDD